MGIGRSLAFPIGGCLPEALISDTFCELVPGTHIPDHQVSEDTSDDERLRQTVSVGRSTRLGALEPDPFYAHRKAHARQLSMLSSVPTLGTEDGWCRSNLWNEEGIMQLVVSGQENGRTISFRKPSPSAAFAKACQLQEKGLPYVWITDITGRVYAPDQFAKSFVLNRS